MSHGPGERPRRDRRARRPASAAEDLTSAQPSADDREEDEAGLLTPRLVFVDIEEGSLDASDFDRAEDRPSGDDVWLVLTREELVEAQPGSQRALAGPSRDAEDGALVDPLAAFVALVELVDEAALPGLEHERVSGGRTLRVGEVLREEVGGPNLPQGRSPPTDFPLFSAELLLEIESE